ncbi:MAG: pyridoxal-dependent decarboxylase [Hyphomonadaceae bacterium]
MDRTNLEALFIQIARYAAERRAGDAERHHAPQATFADQLERFRLRVQDEGVPAEQVIHELIERAEPGLAAITSPRFFGWVMGASNTAGVAADWLTSLWGQNTGNNAATPSSSAVEAQTGAALLDLLDLPKESSVGFVTGATMANFTGLAAARGEMLRRVGWDVEADGMFGAPPVTIILGEEAHSTVFAALKYLGFGAQRVLKVAVDRNGAMIPAAVTAALANASGPAIVIAQAGQINTGAFDAFGHIAEACKAVNAWLHIDGAFGLWARATKTHRHLGAGLELADSWAVDGHKWLQTPYDCGYAIVKHSEAHARAMQIAASYLPSAGEGPRNPSDYVPELSRRARGFATWVMIRHLGRNGVAEMISRNCACARRFAQKLGAESGVEILNDVVLNQVAVRFGTEDQTRAVIARIQQGGVAFVGGSEWRGRWIMRISVTSENTTEADVDKSVDAMLEAWREVRGRN